MKISKSNKPRKQDHFGIGIKASTDSKLSLISMYLELLFEKGVSINDRSITLTGEIGEEQFKVVDYALSVMESQSRKGITVKISSEGGSVYSAMSIVARMRESNCNITTKGYGCVMSAATLILAAGDKRQMSEFSWFMYHEAEYGVEGNHSRVKGLVTQMEREEKAWAKWMSTFSNKSEDFWLEAGENKDTYFTAEELLEKGVVDEIF